MFSRVQEHVHQKTKHGYVPLRSCLSTRCKTKCKHHFPKKVLFRTTVVCKGNYRRLGVRISGRRNALGSVFGRRRQSYQSGTLRGFAVATGSNTHTAPNYRLPPCDGTHDAECHHADCLATSKVDLLRLCKVIHRATREMSGYYLGYTFKGQPVGKRALQLVDKSLDYLVRSLEAVPEQKRFRRTVIRSMVTFHHSTTSRPATEETLLSMYVDDDDVTNAEFVRLYVNSEFRGSCLLRALEREQATQTKTNAEPHAAERRTIPKIAADLNEQVVLLQHFDAVYGYRPNDPMIFYLNAWEFLMWWRVVPKSQCFGKAGSSDTQRFSLAFPDEAMELQEKYILVRRTRPVVPAPSHTPLPERVPLYPESPGRQHEEQCRLYSVYMRPWTLIPKFAVDHVPLITNLEMKPPRRRLHTKRMPEPATFARGWSWYIRGNIVSKHQQQIIKSFLSINCGKSKTDVELDASLAGDGRNAKQILEYDNHQNTAFVRQLLKHMCGKAGAEEDKDEGSEVSRSMNTALQLGANMWGITEETWQLRPQVFLQAKSEASEATAAPGAKKPENQAKRKTRMQLHAYSEYSLAKEKAWFKKLLDPRQTDEVPKPEQERFLRAIAARCRYEARVLKAAAAGKKFEEEFQAPESYALLAPPGTGKTKSITLACQFFQEVLGWTSGVEFQCVASQNRMAGRINGATLHSWGEVALVGPYKNLLRFCGRFR